MPIPIDLRTVTLLAVVTVGLMAIVQCSVYRGFPRFIRGLGAWALGSAVLFVAGCLLMLRATLPSWASVVGGNAMLLVGFCLWLHGIQAFYGRPLRWRMLCATVVIGTAGIAWWTFVQPDYMARLACVTLFLSGLYGAQLVLVIRHGERHFNTWFVAVALVIQLLIVAVRCVTALIPGMLETSFYAVSPVQIAYLASYSMTALILTVGFIMAATRRLQTELEHRSALDPLTGLLNRRAFANVYGQLRAAAVRSDRPIALLLVDLDHFKSINDHYGHGMGDQVLLDFCRRAAATVPAETPIARIGGEEFAILLADTDMARAHAQAEAVRREVLHGFSIGLPPYTCSIGVAGTHGPGCTRDGTLEDLMLAADKALYVAKKAGRNRVETAPVDEDKRPPAVQPQTTAQPAQTAPSAHLSLRRLA